MALAARIVLAVLLASSAVAKLRSRAAVQRQVEQLVSVRAAPAIAVALPAAELIVGTALVAWWSAVPGIAAVLLLVAFTVVLLRAQARRVPCLCFGASKLDTPVGPAAVVRNGVFAAFAVLAIGSPSGATAGATGTLAVGLAVVGTAAVRAAR